MADVEAVEVQRRSRRQDKIALSMEQADRVQIAHGASYGVTASEVLIRGYLSLYVGEREGGRVFAENQRENGCLGLRIFSRRGYLVVHGS